MDTKQAEITCTACDFRTYDYYGKGMDYFAKHQILQQCYGQPHFRR